MTYDDMNSFILNYLKNDITGRAIMLTGEWDNRPIWTGYQFQKNSLTAFYVILRI